MNLPQVNSDAVELLEYVRTLEREHGAQLAHIVFVPVEGGKERNNFAPYIRSACESIIAVVSAAASATSEVDARDQISAEHQLSQLRTDQQDTHVKIRDLERAVAGATSLSAAALNAMPRWLRDRWDTRPRELQGLLDQRETIRREVDKAESVIAQLNERRYLRQRAHEASRQLKKLQDLLHLVVTQLGVELLREQTQATNEALQRARAAEVIAAREKATADREQSLLRGAEALREARRAAQDDLRKLEELAHSRPPQRTHCEVCEERLPLHGVCVHCTQ